MSHADDRLIRARSAIAAACLGALPTAELGTIRLRDDQRRIVSRAEGVLARDGGCLIAEDVGRGKTFVALALARRWRHPLVLVPASLRETWRVAAARAEVTCSIASHEMLSRGRAPSDEFDGLIVDESHHFRTMSTRRYEALALLAARAPVILLSATPLQNRLRDLAAQIALFLGERALSFDAAQLARYVIRGDDAPVDAMPVVRAPEWMAVDSDDGDTLRAILALPAPPRPLDGGDAGALRTISLVRAWASSRAALVATVRTRDRLATAIAQGVDEGRAPTKREARAWQAAEGVVQLGFSSLLIAARPDDAALASLGAALASERESLDALMLVLRSTRDPDVARVAALRALRARFPERRIIAFSEYASTIAALYSRLRGDAGVGMLTAREARIATGRISREELLARFAPVAQRTTPQPVHQSVTLLLATDLLSEGVNLQDASVVVHLDLPWNPARLAQRVGRVRRPGGESDVRTFVLAPPAQTEVLLDVDARLRRKLERAEQVIGAGFPVLPQLVLGLAQDGDASASADGELVARLTRWSRGYPVVQLESAAVHSDSRGWLAALGDGRLIASIDCGAPDDTRSVYRASMLAEGEARCLPVYALQRAQREIGAWLSAEALAESCGIDDAPSPMRRSIERWIDALACDLPRHRRAAALPLIARLRECLRHSLPLGAERLISTCRPEPLARDLLLPLEHAVAIAEAAIAFRVVAETGTTARISAAIVLLNDEGSAPQTTGADPS